MEVTRRQFFRICSAGLGGSSIAMLGFSPTAALAEVREFKLTHATETRNTCPYCSVSCGLLVYSLGDKAKNAKAKVFHIEGDPDHPVNRGTLCPKGSGLIDMINSPQRLRHPDEAVAAPAQRLEAGDRAAAVLAVVLEQVLQEPERVAAPERSRQLGHPRVVVVVDDDQVVGCAGLGRHRLQRLGQLLDATMGDDHGANRAGHPWRASSSTSRTWRAASSPS